jgi:Flp pilus assembly protein TadG
VLITPHRIGAPSPPPFRHFLRRARGAVVALEFGIIAPVMALLVIGVFDISKAAILWEQVWAASRSISESASTLAIQADGSAQLTSGQATQALSLVLADIPWLREGIATAHESSGNAGNTVSAVLTSVDYEIASGCTSNCAYQATVKWSKAYGFSGFNIGSSVLRPCGSTANSQAGSLQQNAVGSPAALGTIPTAIVENQLKADNISVPDPFLMADVKLTYTPYFFTFMGPVTFWATSYWPVRSSVPGTTTGWATLDPTLSTNPNDINAPAQICPTQTQS